MLIPSYKKYLDNFFQKNYEISQIKDLAFVSQVYKIKASEKFYILKVNSNEHYDIYKKENWCLEKAMSIGILVPKVVDIHQNGKYSFMLMEHVAGENCSNIKDIRLETFKQLGIFAYRLATIIPSENIADLKSLEKAKKWFYEDYLEYEINQTSNPDDYLKLEPILRSYVLESLKLLKNVHFEFVLCHGDLSLKNCLYNKYSQTFTLVDFGSAETNLKNYYEIMLKWLELNYEKSISHEEFEAFGDALLGIEISDWYQEHSKIIKSLALLYCLDKYRYAHDRNKDLEESYKSRFYKVLEIIR